VAQRALARQLLLDAAVAAFGERGYAATTVDDIVSAAGTTRATFYGYFSNKADVVRELLAIADASGRTIWRPLRELARNPSRDALRAWLDSHIDWWEEWRGHISALLQAAPSEPELLALQTEHARANVELIVAAVPRFRSPDGQLQALLLLGQLQQLLYFWIIQRWEMDRERVLDLLTDVWWDALTTPAPAPDEARRGTSSKRRT
jgi:AcrR family transcriptional regulator